MAKDRRMKATNKQRRRRRFRGKHLLWIAAGLCCVLVVVFAIVLWNAIKNPKAARVPDSTVNVVDTTPKELQGKVAYYVVGLLGEEETSPMTSLFLLCHDKEKKAMSVLEIPQATYLGVNEIWAEKKAGYVWGNPAPLDWCDVEGKRLFKAQIQECKDKGHTVSQKPGSAKYNLKAIFNEQYALPTDGHFVIPRDAFVKLVDLLGGVSVKLDATVKLGELTFDAGVKTLDGASALAYITMGGDSVEADLQRIARQRQVFLALFQRLCAQSTEDLKTDSLLPLMKGSTPFRTDTSQDEMLAIVEEFKSISPERITAVTIPGGVAQSEGVSYYSVDREKLIEVLNAYFNPYGATITEAFVQISELAGAGTVNSLPQTMNTIAVSQADTVEE